MKLVIQRVSGASVTVADEIIGQISQGLVLFVGIGADDSGDDIEYLLEKTVNMRIFEDAQGKFNLSLLDVKGELLIVSQFTLLASTRKGRRPGFTDAAPPDIAEPMFNEFVSRARKYGLKTETGRFQAYMTVDIKNEGPVTIIIDSRERHLPRK